MAQIPPIEDSYIDDVIKSNIPHNPSLNRTQGNKMRELVKLLRDRLEQEISENYQSTTIALESKVDKEAGKGLSQEDFTSAFKSKLEELALMGVSSGPVDTIGAPITENSPRLFYNTTSYKLRVYNPSTAQWRDAIEADLTNYYTKTEVDALINAIPTPDYPVTSVNGKIGDLIINVNDIPGLQGFLNNKVDKITGKNLSTEDYTTADKTKLTSIQAGAEVNVNADWNAVTGDALILNKPSSFNPSPHTHSAEQITEGIFDINRLPIGTTNGTVAQGNHTHSYNSLLDKPSAFPPLAHVHNSNEITALTEYTIGSNSQVSATDTLNTAIGKLQAQINTKTSTTGTVTSVGLAAPTGLTVSGSPITGNGTLTLALQTGYTIPTSANQNNWNTAFGWGNHAGLYRPISYTPTWNDVSNKPTAFTPSAHTHPTSDISSLTGYTLGTNAAIATNDNLNTALGKLQAQINTKTSANGTVTSVGLTAPTGLTVSGSPITGNGTLTLALQTGYTIPTSASQNNWNTAFSWGNHAGLYRPISYTPTWNDVSNKPTAFTPSAHTHPTSDISSLTGYTLGTNAAIATNDNLNTALGKLQAQINTKTSANGTVTSVGMTAPTGLTVSGSPITGNGTLALALQTGYAIPTSANQNNWNTAFGWGNHAGLYRPISYTPTWNDVSNKPSILDGTVNTHGNQTINDFKTFTVPVRGADAINANEFVTKRQVPALAAQGSGIPRYLDIVQSGIFTVKTAATGFAKIGTTSNDYSLLVPAGTLDASKYMLRVKGLAVHTQIGNVSASRLEISIILIQNSIQQACTVYNNSGYVSTNNYEYHNDFEMVVTGRGDSTSARWYGKSTLYTTGFVNTGQAATDIYSYESYTSGIDFSKTFEIKIKITRNNTITPDISIYPFTIEAINL